jgi:pimeloyl-ACP methyl ester carboxylesterase
MARRALRSLAISLTTDGFVTLRFDHFGTGDSGGSLDDDELDRAWMEGIDQGVALLRSLGVPSVSAVGMRLGATIVGAAAAKYDLGLSSFVMWDPCETGRSYVRELAALGALHRDIVSTVLDESTEMLEYALSDKAAGQVSRLTLIEPTSHDVAERTLVVARDDRPISRKFRARWESTNVEWSTTSEQGPMLEAELPSSVQPDSTVAQIEDWLTSSASPLTPFSRGSHSREAIVIEGSNSLPVRESVVELGFRKMFAIVTEPVGEVRGPLMVMVNGVNEDHIGPARLWVELSRRWASWGLRCVRFDLSELGESPWLPTEPERPVWDRSRPQDIGDAVRALSDTNPADSVLVGYCSGAPLAIVVAQRLKSRGVCAINPQVGAGVFRNVGRVRKSESEPVQTFVRRIENLLIRHRWVDQAIHQITRLVLSSAYPPRISQSLVENHSEMLLVLSPEDLSPLRRNPIVGWILRRRLIPSEHVHIEIVPGLDHAILSTIGRGRAVDILDRHVIDTFLGGVTEADGDRIAVDGL